MTMPPRISVVIPTYRRCESVCQTLRALARQTFPAAEVQVIVSIDGSEDGTREMVAQFDAPYAMRALWQPNRGRAAACNAGIREASGELIILLDDDMDAAPEFLAAHWQAHLTDANLGVMGAVPIQVDTASPPIVVYIGAKFYQHLEHLAQPNHQLKLRDFYSGNFSIRREVLLAAGLFDDAFTLYGNEDLELSLRLTHAGVRLVYDPQALTYQRYTKDFAALAHDHIAKGQTAVLLASKHADTFNDSKLSAYRQGSHKWRALRAILLGLSDAWTRTPERVIQLVARLERYRPARLFLIYTFTLDYFFWLGVRAALRENKKMNTGITSLVELQRIAE